MIERRTRKGKGKLSHAKYGTSSATKKGRKPATKFQKKLVVIDYMGPNPPSKFGLKESMVVLRGLLPEISLDASEPEVRKVIRDTMRDSENTLSMILPHDFEYMEATGKISLCQPISRNGSGLVKQFEN